MRFRNILTALGLVMSLGLAGCTTTTGDKAEVAETTKVEIFSDTYGSVTDAGYALPAIPIQKVDKKFHRQIVDYATKEKPGTVVVNTRERFLYYVLPRGKAVRYGIGVGKQGFAWQGEAYIAWKQAWPTWHPPKEMAERKPEVAKYVEKGMEPACATRSAPAPCISSTRRDRTRCSACTARRNGHRSERLLHRAASA